MKSFTLEDWKKEIQLALSDGKYIHLVNHEIPELKKYMETGIGDVFLKFADAIELLTSITGINSIPYPLASCQTSSKKSAHNLSPLFLR